MPSNQPNETNVPRSELEEIQIQTNAVQNSVSKTLKKENKTELLKLRISIVRIISEIKLCC